MPVLGSGADSQLGLIDLLGRLCPPGQRIRKALQIFRQEGVLLIYSCPVFLPPVPVGPDGAELLLAAAQLLQEPAGFAAGQWKIRAAAQWLVQKRCGQGGRILLAFTAAGAAE